MTPAPSIERVVDVPLAARPLVTVGRTFVHPAFDLFVIGGLLTLPVALFVSLQAGPAAAFAS